MEDHGQHQFKHPGPLDSPPMDHAEMGHSMSMSGGMAMTFHWSYDTAILFDWWHPQDPFPFYVSCIICVVMTIAYEYLKTQQALLPSIPVEKKGKRQTWPNREDAMVRTGLYVLQMALAYIIMLIFMTYNIGLCISVLFGYALGFYLFGAARSQEEVLCH
eukprot:TRINITY_DN8740_c0_g1_i1.p1 TRINITY_DN8740_c0_g1~~TRINITY_DN8740_c0_g1_i1.p1  ORF type:complete len:168 (-),score=15.80 TRINITY_DN8740_c0_g1_i1:51-530(-)